MNTAAWDRWLRIGTIDRTWYFWLGLMLCAVKYTFDVSMAGIVFHRDWTPWDYLTSGSTFSTMLGMQGGADRKFYFCLFALSIPFVTVGIFLTLARLRSAGISPLLVVLFFLPVINLITFLILVMLSPKSAEKDQYASVVPAMVIAAQPLEYGIGQLPNEPGITSYILPQSVSVSIFLCTIYTGVIQIFLIWVSVEYLQNYGWGAFIALPFLCGLISTLLHGIGHRRSLKQCMNLAAIVPIAVALGFIVVGFEGAGCILMYLPLAIPVSLVGGAVGYALQPPVVRSGDMGRMIVVLILFMPMFMGAEHIARPAPPIFAVTTSVDINASPDRVWKNVIAFSEIPAPTDWVFRAGIAYPVRAQIEGQGVGAVRRCVFSTGTFVEPITVWDAPHLLKFDVTSNPPAMKELSPYDIKPPHVRNFLISHGGEFRLIALSDGHTRVEGTTWYEHNLWPAGYWRMWSDFLIHRIHRRVLEHIKEVSERP